MADFRGAFRSREFNVGSDLTAFYRHAEDHHLNPHPQYALSSANAPENPVRGTTWIDPTTMRLLVYYGATTGWAPPWNTAWGMVGTPVTGQSTSEEFTTTVADIFGFSITFDAIAGRRYKATYYAPTIVSTSTADTELYTYLSRGDNTQLAEWRGTTTVVGLNAATPHVQALITITTSESYTVKARAAALSGTYKHFGHTNSRRWMTVEDIGSTGNAPSS